MALFKSKDKELLEDSGELIERSVNKLRSMRGAGSVSQQGEALEELKNVFQDGRVMEVFNQLGQRKPKFAIPISNQAERMALVFRNAAEAAHPDDVMDMTAFMASPMARDTMKMAEDKNPRMFFEGILYLAKNCPDDQKLDFYSRLEQNGFLDDFMTRAGADSVGMFMEDTFRSVETQTALAALENSPAWQAVRGNAKVREAVIVYDQQRLVL